MGEFGCLDRELVACRVYFVSFLVWHMPLYASHFGGVQGLRRMVRSKTYGVIIILLSFKPEILDQVMDSSTPYTIGNIFIESVYHSFTIIISAY